MQKKTLVLIVVSMSVTTAHAWQISEDNDPNWLMNLEAKPAVKTEMKRYFASVESATEPTAYIDNFVPAMHAKMVKESQSYIEEKLSETDCQSAINVGFPERLTETYNFGSKKSFEKSFIRTETYDCLGKLNIEKVFATYMSEAFQKNSIKGLKSIQTNQNNNRTCLEVHIFGIGTSHACITQKILKTETQYVIHSYNEENIGSPDLPVYFKETISVMTQLSSGEVSLYTLMYARGPDLSFRGIIRDKVEEQQITTREFLIEGSK